MPRGTSSFRTIGLRNHNQSNPELRDSHAPCVTETPKSYEPTLRPSTIPVSDCISPVSHYDSPEQRFAFRNEGLSRFRATHYRTPNQAGRPDPHHANQRCRGRLRRRSGTNPREDRGDPQGNLLQAHPLAAHPTRPPSPPPLHARLHRNRVRRFQRTPRRPALLRRPRRGQRLRQTWRGACHGDGHPEGA